MFNSNCGYNNIYLDICFGCLPLFLHSFGLLLASHLKRSLSHGAIADYLRFPLLGNTCPAQSHFFLAAFKATASIWVWECSLMFPLQSKLRVYYNNIIYSLITSVTSSTNIKWGRDFTVTERYYHQVHISTTTLLLYIFTIFRNGNTLYGYGLIGQRQLVWFKNRRTLFRWHCGKRATIFNKKKWSDTE